MCLILKRKKKEKCLGQNFESFMTQIFRCVKIVDIQTITITGSSKLDSHNIDI